MTREPTSSGSPPTAAAIKAEMESGVPTEVALLRAWAKDDPLFGAALERVERREWWDATVALNPRVRLGLFADWWQLGCLTNEELRRDWPLVWTGAEPDDTKPLWLNIWRDAARTGRVEPEPLPEGDPLVVYRGEAAQPARKTRGIAWSLDREVAVFFARRSGGDAGVVIEGRVPRAAILGYVTEREEAEVILAPKDLTVVGITALTDATRN